MKERASLKGFMWFLPVSPRGPIICWNCLLFCDLELGRSLCLFSFPKYGG